MHAVLTANDLYANLHYMPTLAGDVQAVLADEKVLFCNQEVAFVIADDRYIAADAVELIEVEYEALPAWSTRSRPCNRTPRCCARTSRTRPRCPRRPPPSQPHLHLEVGDKAATDDVFASADVTVKELISYQRVHPCPLETRACIGDFDKIKGEITIYGTFQAPHVVRTVVSLLSGILEAKVHVIAPTSAAASATRSASIRAMSAPSSARSCSAGR